MIGDITTSEGRVKMRERAKETLSYGTITGLLDALDKAEADNVLAENDLRQAMRDLKKLDADVERMKGCGQRAYLSLSIVRDELDGCAFQDRLRVDVGKHVDAAIAHLKLMADGE